MATVRKWANVAVAMQSALAAADTITAITKASPAVITATAHGFANGDYILLSVQGMWQMDNKVVRAANITANTFEAEGVDSTSFETFSSGSAYLVTFGTSITTATTISASGGDFDFIDTTTIHSNVKTQIPGLANPLTYSFENLWDAADAGQIAMKTASDSQATRCFKFTFGTGGPIMVFNGYVGYSGAPTGNAQDKVTSPAVITCYGTPSYLAS
jgi:hypothetical protein